MPSTKFRVALLLLPWLLVAGCHSQAIPQPGQAVLAVDSGAVAERLRAVAASGKLDDLRWPNFTDYRGHVQRFYQALNYTPAWIRNGQVTPQALVVIAALENSRQKGLNPEDYDASRWPSRLNDLQTAGGNAQRVADFDAAVTVGAMRYISDLHIGRVDPKHFEFGIDIEQKKYDLPQFLLQKIVAGSDVEQVLGEVEPQYSGYQRTEAALGKYLALAAEDKGVELPGAQKTLSPGDSYAGVEPLARRLRLLGDLPQDAQVDTASGVFGGPLADAVKHFQVRHGLNANGKLDKETLRQLNVPLSARVVQLEDALERWRWLPPEFPQPPVVVNVPEFVLRAFSADRSVALRMNVVVGKSVRHQTPVFADEMKYIVFRPYWNVPLSIARGEIVPALQKDGNYLARKNFEVTDRSGRVVASGAVNTAIVAQIRSGQLLVRQKPGPANSLGLIKFIFPNEHNVYFHSTPAQQLFSLSRRDFSHGCVRLEKPAELAVWVLRNQPSWTLDRVQAAMQSGPDNRQVNLAQPIPVLILYVTAVVQENGEVYFFDDIYGHDRSLNAVLAKGQPYPQ